MCGAFRPSRLSLRPNFRSRAADASLTSPRTVVSRESRKESVASACKNVLLGCSCCFYVSIKGAKPTRERCSQPESCNMSEGRLRLPSPACLSSVLVGVCTRTLVVHFSRFSVGGVAKPSAVDLFGTPGSCSMFIHACVCVWVEGRSANRLLSRCRSRVPLRTQEARRRSSMAGRSAEGSKSRVG